MYQTSTEDGSFGDWKKKTETCPAPFRLRGRDSLKAFFCPAMANNGFMRTTFSALRSRARRGERISGPAVGLPVYEGRMIGQHDFSEKGWVSGRGRSAVWQDVPWEKKQIEPQYLMGEVVSRVSGANVPRKD